MDTKISKKVQQFFLQYKLQTFDKGRIFIYAGDQPPGVFYLESGQVREYGIAASGEELVVNVFKPKAFFPMSWALNKTPNIYFYEAASAATLRMAPAEAAVEFIKSNSDVMLDLLSRVFRGTDGLQQRMYYLMGGNAYHRTALELVIACKRFGKRQSDGSYVVNIKENELAKRGGLTRETFNREIHKLKSSGIIEVHSGGIIIKDFIALEQKLET